MGILNAPLCFNKTVFQKRAVNIKVILKHLFSKGTVAGTFIYLLLSGAITLRFVFIYFKNYLVRISNLIYLHSEKPTRVFKKYRIAPLKLMLQQWRIANQHQSLELVLYAAMPRNPE